MDKREDHRCTFYAIDEIDYSSQGNTCHITTERKYKDILNYNVKEQEDIWLCEGMIVEFTRNKNLNKKNEINNLCLGVIKNLSYSNENKEEEYLLIHKAPSTWSGAATREQWSSWEEVKVYKCVSDEDVKGLLHAISFVCTQYCGGWSSSKHVLHLFRTFSTLCKTGLIKAML